MKNHETDKQMNSVNVRIHPSVTKMNSIKKTNPCYKQNHIYLDTRPNNIRHTIRQATPCMLTMTKTIGDQPPLQQIEMDMTEDK